ncbi:hypothetical protein CsSME_00024452 [Camellia sinensis var. sinensis]
MSRRVSARASKKGRGSTSSAPPPPPSPPSSPPPPSDLPRPEWASRPLHKLTQFNIPYFQRDMDTTWAVEQLQLRHQLGVCTVAAPTYPRLVRLFYQNLYESLTEDGLLSTIDGHIVRITSSMIAIALGFFAKPEYQPFPEVEDRQPIHSLIQQYFPGATVTTVSHACGGASCLATCYSLISWSIRMSFHLGIELSTVWSLFGFYTVISMAIRSRLSISSGCICENFYERQFGLNLCRT